MLAMVIAENYLRGESMEILSRSTPQHRAISVYSSTTGHRKFRFGVRVKEIIAGKLLKQKATNFETYITCCF